MLCCAVVLAAATLASPAHAGVELGLGAAGGGALWKAGIHEADGPYFTAAGSPLLSAQLDPWGGDVRPVFGLTSAPTFSYSMGYDAYTAPLLVLDGGVAFGGDATRATVSGHAGLWSFGASARFTHVPWALGDKAHNGVELRATWLARWGGYLGAMWVVRFG